MCENIGDAFNELNPYTMEELQTSGRGDDEDDEE